MLFEYFRVHNELFSLNSRISQFLTIYYATFVLRSTFYHSADVTCHLLLAFCLVKETFHHFFISLGPLTICPAITLSLPQYAT